MGSVAAEVLEKCRILAGLAIVENAYDQTALIEAIAAADSSREKQLLRLARQLDAAAPLSARDRAADRQDRQEHQRHGFDANVVGRKFNDHKAVEDESPKVKRIALRGLTPQATATPSASAWPSSAARSCCATPTWRDAIECADQRPHLRRPCAVGLPDRSPDARCRVGHGRPGRAAGGAGCCGSPTRCTWSRWSARPPIWPKRGNEGHLEILTELRDLPWDAAGNLRSRE